MLRLLYTGSYEIVLLPTTFGEAPAQTTCMVEFFIVDRRSAYNAIVDRPCIECPSQNNFYLSPCDEIPDWVWSWSYLRKLSDGVRMLRDNNIS